MGGSELPRLLGEVVRKIQPGKPAKWIFLQPDVIEWDALKTRKLVGGGVGLQAEVHPRFVDKVGVGIFQVVINGIKVEAVARAEAIFFEPLFIFPPDIIADEAAFGFFGLLVAVVHNGGQAGIYAAPRGFLVMISPDLFPQIPTASRFVHDPCQAAAVGEEGGSAAYDDIIFQEIIPPASAHDRPAGDTIEDIAEDAVPAQAVVEVYGVHTEALVQGAADVVEEVVADLHAAGAPIPARIKGPGVV